MSDPVQRNRQIEDASLELAMVAAGQERRNKPVWMIVLSVLAVLGAAVYLLVAVSSRVSAEAAAKKQLSKAVQLEAAYEQLAGLIEQGVQPAGGRDARAVSKLQNIAVLAGLSDVQVTENRSITRDGMQLVEYSARLSNQEPDQLLRWLDLAMRSDELVDEYDENPELWIRVPFVEQAGDPSRALVEQVIDGLELRSLELKPSSRGWALDVTFGRWERVGA